MKKSAIFIHAANMTQARDGSSSVGLTQQVLDRIAKFIIDSKIYNVVDSITLGYLGVEGLKFNVPKSNIIYLGPDVYLWEFPTLKLLRNYSKENPDSNVCYLHTQGVSYGFSSPDKKTIDDRRDYHLYWNVTQYKKALENLETHDTSGAMLVPLKADIREMEDGSKKVVNVHANPTWHYSQNFWWARASHINTLPDPQHYPLILDVRHQAEFWVCSSTEQGTHASVHNLYDSWEYGTDFSKELYMEPQHQSLF